MREEDRALLEELLLARGPGGQEDEVRAICQRELEGCCDEVGSDAAGNLVARISPPHLPREQARRAARLLAHLDEIAMIVKRVEADGTLRVALGGAQPVSFGVCPVQILAGEAVLDGAVLRQHACYRRVAAGLRRALGRGALARRHVVTRRSAEELANLGVRPGTRVVLNRRGGARCTSRIASPRTSTTAHRCSPCSAWLARSPGAATSCTATSTWCSPPWRRRNAGALFAARRLPGDISIAVEVGQR